MKDVVKQNYASGTAPRGSVEFGEAFGAWAKIAVYSLGGPDRKSAG